MSTEESSGADDQDSTPEGETTETTQRPADVGPVDLKQHGRQHGWLGPEQTIGEIPSGARAALIAEWITEHEHFLYVKETETFYWYDDGVWRQDGEARLCETAASLAGRHFRRAVEGELKTIYKRNQYAELDEMGTDQGLVPTENYLLDVEAKQADSLKPEHRALWCVSTEFDEDAECPEWEVFLEEVCPDETQRLQLQEFVGYALAGGDPWKERALMLLGPTDSGKSTFLTVIEALFGEDNNAGQTPQNLANQRWGVHQLAGQPVNIRHDIDTDRIQNVGRMKEIISGNPVKAEEKNKPQYMLRPNTRHLFAANRAPETTVDDRAFWNRWLTVVMPETIPPEEQDAELADRIIENELSGVLNWALDGLDRLLEQEQFTAEPSPTEIKETWQTYGDPYARFADAVLVEDTSENVASSAIYDAYKRYAKAVGAEIPSQQKVTSEVKKLVSARHGKPTINGKQQRGFMNLRIDDEELRLVERRESGEVVSHTI